MLLWLNGPFGGGKTQTAHEIQRTPSCTARASPWPSSGTASTACAREFAEHVRTDHIAASAGLTLAPNTDGALRGCLGRAWTGVKHIRFV